MSQFNGRSHALFVITLSFWKMSPSFVRIHIHRASLIVWVSVVLRGTVVGSSD